jgi:hypothetical protein
MPCVCWPCCTNFAVDSFDTVCEAGSCADWVFLQVAEYKHHNQVALPVVLAAGCLPPSLHQNILPLFFNIITAF